MSTVDEISKEKQRLGEALARVDAQREKLTSQLSELEATERVLVRYSTGAQPTRIAATGAPRTTKEGSATSRSGGRQPSATTKPSGGRRGAPTLGDQVLALASGKTQQEIAAACKGARPNHVGVVIARHKRGGRIEERDGKLYAIQSSQTAHSATG